jgi:uncharacterized protein (DUF433 family)
VELGRITTDPEVMRGLPCIRGLRIPVATVVTMVADGMTNDEIMAEHPDLTPEDIHQALLYAAETARESSCRPGTPCERPDGGTADHT